MNGVNGTDGDGHDLVIPYRLLDDRLGDDDDTEQHKAHRGQSIHKRSIRHYGHANSKWGAALESFSPLWFAICISSGGLAVILNGPFPYPGSWQVTCATILYVFEIVIFVLFSVLMLARWILYPHVAVRRAVCDPDELGAYAIPPIALMTLAALTASQVSQSYWGGYSFTLLAYVLWWIGVCWVFVTTIVVLVVLFYTGNQADRIMTPVMFMAPVGLATAGTEAGFITIHAAEMSARLAVPQIIVGYFAIGLAFFMAILLYTVYFHRLLTAGWAPVAKRAGLFILIGPCGQLATGFQLLGTSANQYMRFAQYKPGGVHPPESGVFFTSSTASGIDGAGILFALLLLGFDYFWICIAIVGVLDAFINHRRQVSYSLVWWSLVFPLSTFCTAWLELATSMASPAFSVLTSIVTVIIAIIYFANLGFTIWGLVDGSLVWAKSQIDREAEMMQKAQQEEKREV